MIALVTSAEITRPDPETHLLVAALSDLGVGSRVVEWESGQDWAAFPLVVLRTPWGYHRRVDDFLGWTEKVETATRLLNPASLVRWNAHKGYLLELERAGVPVLPTTLLRAGGEPGGFDGFGAGELVVVKPAFGAGASGALRGAADDPAVALHIGRLLAAGDALVQPFAHEVAAWGELSLIFFEGAFSHAVRKVPAEGDFRVHEQHGGSLLDHDPSEEELRVARAALAAAPGETAYARVDLVRWHGEPAVMELELIEPELFLRRTPDAPAAFAAALTGRL
jgi:glutathione synthase/RimK-type ligase-like ATP-grasp enzyme